MKHSKVEVFHGKDLDAVVDNAVEKCPVGYEIVDFNVNFINDEYVVTAKIEKESDVAREIYAEMFSDDDVHQLDIAIAEFLEENPDIEIKHVTQSSATFGNGNLVTIITIWYEE